MLSVIAICAGGALIGSARQSNVYEAEASLSFREPTQDIELIGLPAIRYASPEQRAAAGAEEANRREILEAAIAKVGIREPVEKVDGRVSARPEIRTNLVIVSAQAGSAEEAARLANAVADVTVENVTALQRRRYEDLLRAVRRERRRVLRGDDTLTRAERRRLEQQLVPLRTTLDLTEPVRVVEPASVPPDPISPRPVRNTAIGLIVGIILALLLATLRVSLDRRLRGAAEIQATTDLPLLTLVRDEALGRVNQGLAPVDDSGEYAESDLEAFRILRTNLDYLDIDADLKRIVVTSPLPQEGKSTVAASLAVAMALSGRSVLLVECDLRRPVLAERFGIDASPGLTEYLAGRAEPQDVVRVVAVGGAPDSEANGGSDSSNSAMLAVIPSGQQAPRPAELLASDRFSRFLDQVSGVYDAVIIDTPPMLPVGDTLELIPHADAVLLCVRSDRTTRDDLRAAVSALRRLPDKPAGLVVTGVRHGRDSEYGYYTYSYAYGPRG